MNALDPNRDVEAAGPSWTRPEGDRLLSVSVRVSLWASRGAAIDAGISACGGHRQSAEVMRPTFVVGGALGGVGKTAMGHAHQGAAVPVDQVDLDEARSWRYGLAPLPTEAVGEPMHRDDLAELPARHVRAVADAFDEIEPAGVRLGRHLSAHPAQDLFGIGQKGEDGGGWGRDMDLTPDRERFGHQGLLGCGPRRRRRHSEILRE